MPKKHRLSNKDFLHLPQKGRRRIDGTHFSLSVSVGEVGEKSKIACVVSKKIVRKAVERNKIKRRVREIIRPLIISKITSTQNPIYYIFYTKKTATNASYRDIAADIEKLIAKV